MHTLPDIDDIVASALAEDLGVSVAMVESGDDDLSRRDATSAATIPAHASFSGVIVARTRTVVCGLPLVERVYDRLSRSVPAGTEAVEVFPLVAEGSRVAEGAAVAEVRGPARLVLAGERTALDFLMVLSGIAAEAARWQEVAGPDLVVTDTRKTIPGLRALSKYAVRVGGGHNHRGGLWDMVLIKDNHITAAGGVAAAVAAARRVYPTLAVEVEADTVEQAVQAARAGADIVLLDNMDDETLAAAVAAVHEAAPRGRTVLTEASGGIRFERLDTLRDTGVDRVSTSALTMAPPADFALDEAPADAVTAAR